MRSKNVRGSHLNIWGIIPGREDIQCKMFGGRMSLTGLRESK